MPEEQFRKEVQAKMISTKETITSIDIYQGKDLVLLKKYAKQMKQRRVRRKGLNKLLSVYESLLTGEKWEV